MIRICLDSKRITQIALTGLLIISFFCHLAQANQSENILPPSEPMQSCEHDGFSANATGKKVLILYSFNPDSLGTKAVHDGVFQYIENYRNSVNADGTKIPNIFEEYVDFYRLGLNKQQEAFFVEYLQKKYACVQFDYIASFASYAEDLLKKYPQLFKSAERHTISFHQVWRDREISRQLRLQTLEVVERLLPDTQKIILPYNKRQGDLPMRYKEIATLLNPKISFVVWDEFSFDELYEQTKNLDRNTAILYTALTVDKNGQNSEPAAVLKKLIQVSPVPVFIYSDTFLNMGTVGGLVTSHKSIGEIFAKKLLGESTPQNSQDIVSNVMHYYFDDTALKRWHIPDSRLPPGSSILNRKESLFYIYRWYLAGVLSLFIFESLLVGWLMRSLRHRKMLTRMLTDERNLLELRVQERTEDLTLRSLQLEESQTLFQNAAKISKLGVFHYNLDTGDLKWDKSMFSIYDVDISGCMFSGCNSTHCLTSHCDISLSEIWRQLVFAEDLPKVQQALRNTVRKKAELNIRFRIKRKHHQLATIHAIGQVYYDETGNPLSLIGINQDVTEQEEAINIIRNLAYFDPLTQLPNRRLLAERMKQTISRHSRKKEKFAVLVMDLDKFKLVNDTLGHGAGDELLQQVAKRICDHIRECDTVARIGGDEFVIILERISCNENIAKVAEALIHTMAEPFLLLQNNQVQIGISIGIAVYPEHGEDGDELITKADKALYQSKGAGRGRFSYV